MHLGCLFSFFLFISVFLSACSKEETDSSNVLSVASINSISQERKTTGSIFRFSVSLDKAATKDATVYYFTTPATAKENIDFTSVSGLLTIPAGQKQATFDVVVTGDSTRKEDQYFTVEIDTVSNCLLGNNFKGTGTIINANGFYYPVDNSGYFAPNNYAGYSFVWSDEFDGKKINDANWSFETGNNNGWGNNELQYYTDRLQNAFVSNGNLIIEARKENYQGSNYTSARLITKDKKKFTYGRVDIRAKLPIGRGIWPALWMLGSNISTAGWPACGEIDIMELLGQEPNKIYSTVHWGSSPDNHLSEGGSYISSVGTFNDVFHIYSMVWDQDSIKMYIDNFTEFFSISKTDVGVSDYPFNNDFFFIFNVAVGGNWPGSPDGTTAFPQRLVIDYIRVFQK